MKKIIVAISCIITGACAAVDNMAVMRACSDHYEEEDVEREVWEIFNEFWNEMCKGDLESFNLDEYKRKFNTYGMEAVNKICYVNDHCVERNYSKMYDDIRRIMSKCRRLVCEAEKIKEFFTGDFARWFGHDMECGRCYRIDQVAERRKIYINNGREELQELKNEYVNVLRNGVNDEQKINELLTEAERAMCRVCSDIEYFDEYGNRGVSHNCSEENMEKFRKCLNSMLYCDVLLIRSIIEHLTIMLSDVNNIEMSVERQNDEDANVNEENVRRIDGSEIEEVGGNDVESSESEEEKNETWVDLFFENGNFMHFKNYDSISVMSALDADVTLGELLRYYSRRGNNE